MNIETDRALLPPGVECTRYLLVRVEAPKRPEPVEGSSTPPRRPLHVAFALDRSGSMEGEKLALAKLAIERAIELLGPQDEFSIVTFSNEAETVVRQKIATPEARAKAVARLNAVEAGQSTNLAAGWARAAEYVKPATETPTNEGATPNAGEAAHKNDPLRRVIVLSDGLANVGEFDPSLLGKHAMSLRQTGIVTTTIGLGGDFDEVLMSRMATDGGGHFYFIESAQQIPTLLFQEMGEALDVVARNARLYAQSVPVRTHALDGFAQKSRGLTNTVFLGDLVVGQQITVILEVRCGASEMSVEKNQITCRVGLADDDNVFVRKLMEMKWVRVDKATHDAQPVNADMLLEVAAQIAANAKAEALLANRANDFPAVRRILRSAGLKIRGLITGNPRLEIIALELEGELKMLLRHLEPMVAKQRHFENYTLSQNRDSRGFSRRA